MIQEHQFRQLQNEFLGRVNHVELTHKRYLYHQINWDARLIGIRGARGTGKTTMLLQYIKEIESLRRTVPLYLQELYQPENAFFMRKTAIN